MDLEQITLALRPRGHFEAIDLGFRMAAAWWKPVWGTWLLLFVPVAVALHLALPDSPFWAAFLLWWLKPLFDRFVLYVLSRRVFGDAVGTFAALGAWREVLRPGLIGDLSWGRLSPRRSFVLPVALLERGTGAVAKKRRRLLGNRTNGHAFALSFACACFELSIWSGLAFLFEVMLVPERPTGVSAPPAYEAWVWWTHADSLWYLAAASVIEPFYVAAGFALYLNRRVGLEAWDVELALRRLERRLLATASKRAAAAGLVLGLALGDLHHAPCHAAAAEPLGDPPRTAPTPSAPAPARIAQDTEAKRLAIELYAHPDFGGTREVERWQFRQRNGRAQAGPQPDPNPWLVRLLEGFAQLLRVLAWIGVGVLVIVLLVAIVRRYARSAQTPIARAPPPAELFGLAIDPDSLPADVGGQARAACRAGDARGALSLIYRGALSALVHGHGLAINAGAVEADVLRQARGVLSTEAVVWFGRVIEAWIAVAWARQAPDLAAITALVDDYERHVAATTRQTASASGVPA